jgi:nucleoside-diphosphate-sugar epimerase
VKVLVLGGTRFLGPFVAEELLRRGHEVAVLSRGTADFARPVRRYAGDASDSADLRRAMRSWRPEAIVDMLHHSPEHAEAVARAFAGRVTRSVHLSCAAVYGPNPICPVDEQTETLRSDRAPAEVAAQIRADEVVLKAAAEGKLPAVVMRLAELYGPRDPRCAEWFFARRVLDRAA